MKLTVLGSGSTGNAVLIVAGNTRVLVDAGMIAVFVRHEHRIETLRIFANDGETAGNFFCTQTRVDEHACIACNDQDRIPSGATTKNGNLH